MWRDYNEDKALLQLKPKFKIKIKLKSTLESQLELSLKLKLGYDFKGQTNKCTIMQFWLNGGLVFVEQQFNKLCCV